MSSKQSGFSTATTVVIACFVLAGFFIGWYEYSLSIQRSQDRQNKASLNAIYGYLENVYYPVRGSYPTSINDDFRSVLPKENRRDSQNQPVASQTSTVRYEPRDCINGACKKYELTAILQNEPDYRLENQRP